MSGRLGVFGGTFDPPHLGHMILALEACAQLHLSKVLWVLTPEPPHKLHEPISMLEDRLAMVNLALKDEPVFELSTIEFERPGPHYSSDTLRILRDRHLDMDLVLLLGGDSLHDLPHWNQPQDVLALCHKIGVMSRPGIESELSDLESQLPGISSKIQFLDAPLLGIAASDVRKRVLEGLPFRYYLLPAVYDYVLEQGLYRA